jgi:hypothetical protein
MVYRPNEQEWILVQGYEKDAPYFGNSTRVQSLTEMSGLIDFIAGKICKIAAIETVLNHKPMLTEFTHGTS